MTAEDLKKSAAAARRTASGIEAFVAGQRRAGTLNAADDATLKRAIEILRKSGRRLEGQSHQTRAKEKRYKVRLVEAQKCVQTAFGDRKSPEDAIVLSAVAGFNYSLAPSSLEIWLNPDASQRGFGRVTTKERAERFVEHLIEQALSDISHRLAGDDDPLNTGGDIAAGVVKVQAHVEERRAELLKKYSYVKTAIDEALSTPDEVP